MYGNQVDMPMFKKREIDLPFLHHPLIGSLHGMKEVPSSWRHQLECYHYHHQCQKKRRKEDRATMLDYPPEVWLHA